MAFIVRDVMTTEVVTVTEHTSFKEIAGLLAAHRIGALPVLDCTGRVSGVVSEADLLLKQEHPNAIEADRLFESARHRAEQHRARGRLAATMMSTPAVTVSPDTPVALAARLMHSRKVKHLPVVDADGILVGIVSRGDLLKVFLRGDASIQAELREVAAGQLGEDLDRASILVTGGIVTLTGTVRLRSSARTIALLARELDGVVGVDSRLDYETDDLFVPYPIV